MSLPAPELSLLLCACAAAFPVVILCAAASAQSQPDADAKTIVAKIDAARGKPAKATVSLAIEGTFTMTFDGVANGQTVMDGKFREIFAGENRARHTSDFGEHGVLERGITEGLVWEIDPVMGARVLAGVDAVAVRRYFALLRGASPGPLYREFKRTGTQTLDGREHAVLRMTPAEGKADTWFVDAESGFVSRIDITLPTSEGADAVWALGSEVEAQITFADWQSVDGMRFPKRRNVKTGPATFAFTCTKIETGAVLEPDRFTPPPAVQKVKDKPTSKPTHGKPGHQVVELEAQPVASIRVKCTPATISATLAMVLPEVMSHLNASGAKIVGVPFSRYHAFGADEIDLEAGIPVAKPIEEKGRVKNSELPSGKAVTAWHIGSYEKLGDAHAALRAYLKENQLEARGGPWELYWTDPGMVPDPSKWRTQLYVAIDK